MSRIYWDTMLFIYWFEENPGFAERVTEIFLKMQERGDAILFSAFGVGELLVAPKRAKNENLKQRMTTFMQNPNVEILPFDSGTIERYSEIRASYPVSAADAIHLSCASVAHADLFLTNDKKLIGKTVPGIQFVAGLDVNLF